MQEYSSFLNIRKNVTNKGSNFFLLLICEKISRLGIRSFAQVAHQIGANEQIALFFEWIAHSLIFLQKTSDLLGKPMSEFPALRKSLYFNGCELLQRQALQNKTYKSMNCKEKFVNVWIFVAETDITKLYKIRIPGSSGNK